MREENLKELQSKIREKEKQLGELEQKNTYEDAEEELHWDSKRCQKISSDMWDCFRGKEAARYFRESEDEFVDFRNRMRIDFEDKYDEIDRTRNYLQREREELGEQYHKEMVRRKIVWKRKRGKLRKRETSILISKT